MRVYKDKGQVQSSGSAFEISTPYLEAELFELKFAQSADVMYFVIQTMMLENFQELDIHLGL